MKEIVSLTPFVGSGTSCVVAKKLNRAYIGVEIDQYYVCITKKIEQYIHKHDTRLHGRGILGSKHPALSKENIKRFAMVDSHNGAY